MQHFQIIVCLVTALFTYQTGIAQVYTRYITGDTSDVETYTTPGICLMGGRTEQDDAMKIFLKNAHGGDVVVLRASGSDGYNDYLYSDLGIPVNSVESIVLHSAEAGTDTYVISQVAQAEALWFAGGDQYKYIEYIKDTPLEDTINYLINNKTITIGGTSAGMAIMGQTYFPAQEGTLYSNEALSDPYGERVVIGHDDFLETPFLKNTITDTHYDREDPDGSKTRKGRHVTFLARMSVDYGVFPYGIACEEYTAVFIDSAGIARVYGSSSHEDYAYFLKPTSQETKVPETCIEGEPLSWQYNNNALSVYKVKGNEQGSGYLDLNTWEDGANGTWYNWYVFKGALFEIENSTSASNPSVSKIPSLYPNPVKNVLCIDLPSSKPAKIKIADLQGRIVFSESIENQRMQISTQSFLPSMYLVQIEQNNLNFYQKVLAIE